jgi:sodium-dependent dicarboxylate transporter 2/3/5
MRVATTMRRMSGAAPSTEQQTSPIRPKAIACTALVALVAALAPFPALSPAAHRTLVILVAAAGLWMTEALPVAVTALLIPLLAVLLRVADAKTAFAGFADPIVFLFLGTFLLTTAAFDYGLHARLTRRVLRSGAVRTHPTRLLWVVAALGCGISAWVNNTATTALLLPLALTAEGRLPRPLVVGTLLLAAYGPSLGGVATPVGTAPNLIGLRLLEEGAHAHISFAHWCAVFAPFAILSTALTAGFVRLCGRGAGLAQRTQTAAAARALDPPEIDGPAAITDTEAVGGVRTWSRAEKTLLAVCAGVVVLWIVPGLLLATSLRSASWLKELSARLPETSVPLLGALLLFILPRGAGKRRILNVEILQRVDWSTILLFGGGLSLGGLMFSTGLAKALGEAIFAATPFRGLFGVVLAATIMAVAVSELTSNTASATLVVPVVLALAQAAGVDPVKPALAATVGCSFGFMLPVSTPPNALVYATGKVPIIEMIRYGVLLDLAGVVLISVWASLFA